MKKVVGGTTTYYVGNWYEVTNSVATKYYYFGAQRVAMRTSAGVTYLHGDHLGSTSVASNASGAFHSRQTYYAFGGVRTIEGTLPTDYTFTGQKRDAEAGLMYYGARYYDGTVGRFIQPDIVTPNIFNPQDLNRYSYVRNNPLKYVDPNGREPITAAAVLAYLGWTALNTAVDTGIDFIIAKVTGDQFNLGQSLATNGAINVATAGLGGKVSKIGKVGTLTAKYGDDVVKATAKYADTIAKLLAHTDDAAKVAKQAPSSTTLEAVVFAATQNAQSKEVVIGLFKGGNGYTDLGHKSGKTYLNLGGGMYETYFKNGILDW